MAIRGPFNVLYPVAFRSGGDTTRVAFGKHIQEIERIYGILNALDSDKISASDLDGMLGNFKPKLSFSDISGNLDMSKITGNLDGSRISGQIDASKIFGKLSNANIDAGNVNGLSALVKTLIPDDNGDGITDFDVDTNGYVVFGNGLMLQWGNFVLLKDGETNVSVTFPKPFPNQTLNVIHTLVMEKYAGNFPECYSYIYKLSKSGYVLFFEHNNGLLEKMSLNYLAIGY